MPVLPWWLEAAIAAELLYAVHRAFRGAPPRRRDRFAAAAWLGAAVLLIVTGALSEGRTMREILIAPGVIAACVGSWWLRSPRGTEDDGGAEAGGAPDPPVDWDEFDRLRAGWRPRQTA